MFLITNLTRLQKKYGLLSNIAPLGFITLREYFDLNTQNFIPNHDRNYNQISLF